MHGGADSSKFHRVLPVHTQQSTVCQQRLLLVSSFIFLGKCKILVPLPESTVSFDLGAITCCVTTGPNAFEKVRNLKLVKLFCVVMMESCYL